MKICHITTAHTPHDIRIYKKEVMSLSEHLSVSIALNTNEDITDSKINFIKVRKSNNRLFRFLKDGLMLYKRVVKENFDVIHFHDPDFILFAYLISRKNTKVIYDVHEDVPRAIMSKHWIPKPLRKIVSVSFEVIENFFARRFNYIVTATPFIKKRFIKLNSNTEVINNYPLLNEFSIDGINKEDKLNQVSYVGGLNSIRGLNFLAEASLLTTNKIKIAGKVASTPYKHKLELLGQLNREEVKELLGNSIAGLVTFLPEPNHINAKPNKMFEYMSASLPIICSNFEEWEELIEENKNGITVNPNNPHEIASVIDYLIDNPHIAKEMGENGRRAVENKYNWNVESVKLINIYNQILEEK